MKFLRQVAVLCALIGSLGGISTALAADLPSMGEGKESSTALGAKDLFLKGDAKCTRCHDETDSPKPLAIGKRKHGTTADSRTPTCTTCHGDSDSHRVDVAEGEVQPKPDRVFSRKSTTPARELSATCLECHQGSKRIHWQGSVHDARDVTCASCHTVHAAHDKVKDKLTQAEVCYTCHKEQRAQMSRPSRHPVKEGKVACSDCHNPHGSAGVKLLVRDNVVDTCYTCHMEKRGPFIWNHQPVTEDCGICHNPHGTTTANLLKSRPPFLCQQCHEATSHRGNIPNLTSGTPGGTSGMGITLARGCLNCHTNIHGSNNPINNSSSRTMRR
jgi:DmsE family decaheme c-type cytochrome